MERNWQVPNAEYHEMKQKTSKYCIIIPIINEGERIIKQLTKMKSFSNDIDLVIVDGGSTDGSTNINLLQSMGVRTLIVKKDKGKLSSQLRIGYAYALKQGYEGIITIDGNDKDDVNAIPIFINELESGFDFIQGSRYIKGGKAVNTPIIRDVAIKLIHAPIISLVAGFRYTDTTNGFRGYSRRYILDPRVNPFREIFDTYELLAYLSVRASQLGFQTKEVPVTRKYPDDGKVPTKINSFSGNLSLLMILVKLIMGSYNPGNDIIEDEKGRSMNV
ncbi:glycosyltransferase family 2 protein [Bacillus sp. T33-2]|uniref:glycosyltransferase family 2 protein n=1 Tax=Bacillus sp. T33-2 TaxID=2054168 RepID=UPI000C773368|nr:glycosyltransferase family 2 protein [Bacillus sp. T33-2]PLR90769.1 glycosyl transferase family 2 [Bacillus sp. T33-2]